MSNRNTSDCNYAIRPAWPSPPASRRDCDAVGLTAGWATPIPRARVAIYDTPEPVCSLDTAFSV